MNREAAIEAGARALFESRTGRAWDEDVSVLGRPTSIARHNAHRDAAAVIDAALPHLAASLKAEALREAAAGIQALHPGEVKNSVIWLHDRANRIERGELP